MVAFTASLSARSVNFIPACPGLLRMSFRRWMSTLTHGSLYCLFGWWPHLAWQWSRTLISLWLPSHQCILWDLVICCFLEWDAWSLTQFCLPAILDGAFPRFLAGVSRRDAAVGLVPLSLLGLFELCQLAYLQYWSLAHSTLAPSQSAFRCLLRLRGVGCGDVHFSSVQFKMVSMRSTKSICAPLRLSQVPQRCLWNGSNVRLIDEVALSRVFFWEDL